MTQEAREGSFRTGLIGVFIVLGFQCLVAIWFYPSSSHQFNTNSVLHSIIFRWSEVVFIFLFIKVAEKLPLSSIKLVALRFGDFLWGFVGFLVGLIFLAGAGAIAEKFHLQYDTHYRSLLLSLPIGWRFATVFTAGVTEEIIFRGYLLERIAKLTHRLWIGVVLSSIVFMALHIPFWGKFAPIGIGAWTAVVIGLYLWKKSLYPCIIMHVLNDVFILVIVPYLASLYGINPK